MSVTPQYLLHGAAYALEQCGLLLRDANILYRSGSYASTVVVTAFAREELGRSSILFDLRRRTLAGEAFTVKQIRQACKNHVAKQQAGMLSLTYSANKETSLGKAMRAIMENPPQSTEWQETDAELKRIDEANRKRIPKTRHEKRIAALYVEPTSGNRWVRPAATSATEAHDFLQHAVNDYAGRYHQRYITSAGLHLKLLDPELYEALEQWSERPELTPPEWPAYPGYQQAPENRKAAGGCSGCSLIGYLKELARALIKRAANILAMILHRYSDG